MVNQDNLNKIYNNHIQKNTGIVWNFAAFCFIFIVTAPMHSPFPYYWSAFVKLSFVFP